MTILILPKGKQPDKFKCPVCHEEYASYFEAMNCSEIHGFPKENFKTGDRVLCISDKDKGIVGILTNISYAKPGHFSRTPHTPIFTIKVEKKVGPDQPTEDNPLRKYTTAHEGEIEIYQET